MKLFLRRNLRTIILLLALAALLCALRLFVIHPVRIEGSSMESTFCRGDWVLVTKFDYLFGGVPERGDVVECRFPNRSGVYIKRVIGLPNETVQIRDGRVRIDGQPISEPYATGPMEDYEARLGEDEYLVLGDNRSESYDSRADDMGFLHADCFLGRVRLRLKM